MNTYKQLLKDKYHLTNYQIAQLVFLTKTFVSETSKILIMGMIFHKYLKQYLFALVIMLVLRCFSGGVHFDTYPSCLLASILFLWTALILLPDVSIIIYLKILLLLISLFACHFIGPITSKYRPAYSKEFIRNCKYRISIFIFLYALLTYIIPDSQYLTVGFWVIVLHTSQLIFAKFVKKGGVRIK